jgi:FixJ family two-component response regulator
LDAARRILLVDDDPSVRRALSRLLRSYGFEVTAFASAAELLAAGPPQAACLVADVRMPEMGGVELVEHLQASGRDIPTVFITAHGTEGLRSMVLESAPVLQKPVDGDAIVAAIEAQVSQRELRDAR